jgi:hypothetical protein
LVTVRTNNPRTKEERVISGHLTVTGREVRITDADGNSKRIRITSFQKGIWQIEATRPSNFEQLVPQQPAVRSLSPQKMVAETAQAEKAAPKAISDTPVVKAADMAVLN